jgi:hypothetical protein
MKGRHAGGSKTMVMLALLAVLLVSLGYLSMQGGGREGLTLPTNPLTNPPVMKKNPATPPM